MTKLCKFYLRLLHPKEIAEKAAEHFFFLLTYSLIFEMSISGGSAKKDCGGALFFGAYCMVYFFEKIFFALRKILGKSLFRKLFILFTEIMLKLRVCLHDTPH
jgi:hypothetical protein